MNKYKEIPIFIFCNNERTIDFSIYCIKKLGFKNIFKIDNPLYFHEKLYKFCELGAKLNEDFFIRTDSDRFIFSGIFDLIEEAVNNKHHRSEGLFFDKLMNRKRGGTPHIYSRKILEGVIEGKYTIDNHLKPESGLSWQLRDKHGIKINSHKILTNLHEYEQYPSKIINTFVNRLLRNNHSLYNWNELKKIGFEKEVNKAFELFNKNKNKKDCSYFDGLDLFDNDTESIRSEDFPVLYQKCLKIYDSLK